MIRREKSVVVEDSSLGVKYFVTAVRLTAILQSLLNGVIQFWMPLTNNNSLVENKSWF